MQSRLECARLVICDGMDNPLDDQNSLTQQLDQISTICRCEYESTTTLLKNFFDQVGQEYSRVLNGQVNEQEKKIIEFQISWLVFIIGAAVGGRISITSSDEHDALDGDLSIKILMLMDVINNGLENGKGRSEAIELAMLQFFDQFRKIYVGDQVHKSSKAYMRLSEVCSLNDESDILDVLVKKIIINLKYWGESEKILVGKNVILDQLPFLAKNASTAVRSCCWLRNCSKANKARLCQAAPSQSPGFPFPENTRWVRQ